MADPTENTTLLNEYEVITNQKEFKIKDTVQLRVGAILGLDVSIGRIDFFDPADANHVPCGMCKAASNGDNDAGLLGDTAGTTKAIAVSGITLKNVDVTGASADTDIGSLVYAQDGQTFDLTQSGTEIPCGRLPSAPSGRKFPSSETS